MLEAVVVVRWLYILGLPGPGYAFVPSRICAFLRVCVLRRHALDEAQSSQGSKRQTTSGWMMVV